MKDRRTVGGFVLCIIGIILIVIAIIADTIGIGGTPGFGFKQAALFALGAFVTIAGVILIIAKKNVN